MKKIKPKRKIHNKIRRAKQDNNLESIHFWKRKLSKLVVDNSFVNKY